jgi:hypothetical protein
VAARLGGDEFCVLLPRANAGGAATSAERIRLRVGALRFLGPDQQEYSVTRTFGLAELSPGMTGADLLQAADQALYSAYLAACRIPVAISSTASGGALGAEISFARRAQTHRKRLAKPFHHFGAGQVSFQFVRSDMPDDADMRGGCIYRITACPDIRQVFPCPSFRAVASRK